MAAVVAEAGADLCLMHMQGEPGTMQDDPRYEDVGLGGQGLSRGAARLRGRQRASAEDRIWLDPGIGFGKTLEHNLELLRRLDEIVAIGRPVVVGASRKRFIGALTGRPEGERLAGSLAAAVIACERGAAMVRVHDVAETREALALAAGVGPVLPSMRTR